MPEVSRPIALAAFVAGLAGTSNAAQSDREAGAQVWRLPAAEIAAQVDPRPGDNGTALREHPTDGTYRVLTLRRDVSGDVEVHTHWNDVFYIQSGRGEMIHGGRADGLRPTGPGELRGGTIAGGQRFPFGPGDMFVIPAGTPHQLVVPPRGSVRYAVVKTRH